MKAIFLDVSLILNNVEVERLSPKFIVHLLCVRACVCVITVITSFAPNQNT